MVDHVGEPGSCIPCLGRMLVAGLHAHGLHAVGLRVYWACPSWAYICGLLLIGLLWVELEVPKSDTTKVRYRCIAKYKTSMDFEDELVEASSVGFI